MCSNSPETDALVLASELAMSDCCAIVEKVVRAMVDEGIGFWGYFFDTNNMFFDPFGSLFDANNIFWILLDIFFDTSNIFFYP
jgi:hypothetical protein